MIKTSSRLKKSTSKNFKVISAAFEQTADHMVITDLEGNIVYVNPAFEKTTGFAAEEAIGKTPRILKSGKQSKKFYQDMWKTILSGQAFQGTIINKKKNGKFYHADQTVTPILDDHGAITHFVSIWKDVTKRVEARAQLNRLHEDLKLEKQKLEKILHFGEKIETFTNFHKLIDFIVEQASSILESERCSLMLLDEEKGEMCIRGAVGLDHDIIKKSKLTIGEGIAGLVAQEGKPMLVKVINTDKRVKRDSLPAYKTKSFLSVPIELDRKLIGVLNVTDKINKNNPAYTELDLKILLTIVRQVAVAIENAQLSKELKYLTVIDPLTELYNHRYLMESLAYEIKRFKRFGRSLCLLIIDVDDFKKYNDDFGHIEGDKLLKRIAQVLKDSLREVDIICRYAGDAFIAVLPETSETEVKRLAEMIHKAILKLKFKRSVTMSMGIAKCQDKMNRHDFIAKANAALNYVKTHGKDNIYCQSEVKKVKNG